MVTKDMIVTAIETGAKFPPAFQENAFAYALALASLASLAFVSFSIIVGYLLEARLNIRILERLGNIVSQRPAPYRTVLFYERWVSAGLLFTIFLGTFPDVLVLVLWNEVSAEAIIDLYLFDRICDGLVFIPYFFAIFLGLAFSQAKRHRLTYDAPATTEKHSKILRWSDVWEKAQIIAMAIICAVGIAFYKSLV